MIQPRDSVPGTVALPLRDRKAGRATRVLNQTTPHGEIGLPVAEVAERQGYFQVRID